MKRDQICPHTLQVLEFDLILSTLASFASSELGRQAVKRISPSVDRQWIERRLAETSQLQALLDLGTRLPLSGLSDIGPRLRSLGRRQTLFEPADLIAISDTLAVSGHMRHFLGRLSLSDYPLLCAMAEELSGFEDLVQRINRCIDGREGVLDQASDRLLAIRRHLRELESEIRRQFTRIVASPQMRCALENDNFLLRHGRPVVAVKAHYRSHLRGTILDRSHSGGTLYIEPDELVELNGQLEETKFAEKKEVDSILWDLTHRVLDRRDEILGSLRTLARIDLTYAKARFSTEYEMSAPEVGDALDLRGARHPLLLQWASAQAQCSVREVGQRVVSISPRLGDDFDLLLVTGPNTGGKTVLLKTIGLCQLMAQCGMHIPAQPGSRVTVYRQIFADIGDEQSIQQSLSTFSAHMQRVIDIMTRMEGLTLVLLDELGAGTDPAEGASLAAAILDEFLLRGAHIVATTHLGQLKTFAYTQARAENASVQFDTRSLKPTYRLFIGTPGSSNALTIANRLGMPERVIRFAGDLLAKQGEGASELINKVQETRELAEQKRRQAEAMLSAARDTRQEAALQRDNVEAERKRLQAQADRQVDDTMKQMRAAIHQFEQSMANAPQPWNGLVREWVQRVIRLSASTPLSLRHQQFIRTLQRGDTVHVIPLRRNATVDRLRPKKEVIQVLLDGKRIEVSFEQVSRPA